MNAKRAWKDLHRVARMYWAADSYGGMDGRVIKGTAFDRAFEAMNGHDRLAAKKPGEVRARYVRKQKHIASGGYWDGRTAATYNCRCVSTPITIEPFVG